MVVHHLPTPVGISAACTVLGIIYAYPVQAEKKLDYTLRVDSAPKCDQRAVPKLHLFLLVPMHMLEYLSKAYRYLDLFFLHGVAVLVYEVLRGLDGHIWALRSNGGAQSHRYFTKCRQFVRFRLCSER